LENLYRVKDIDECVSIIREYYLNSSMPIKNNDEKPSLLIDIKNPTTDSAKILLSDQ